MKIIVETSSGALSVACVREGLGVSIIAGSRQGTSFYGLGVRSVRKWFGDARIIFLRKRGAYRAPALQQLTGLIQATAEGR